MSSLPRLYEFTTEEMLQQFKDGDIDVEFMCSYIEEINKVFNQFVEYTEILETINQNLKENIMFCLKSIKQEMEMSIDSRTRQEMKNCYEILKEAV